jgi:hypothetical protein
MGNQESYLPSDIYVMVVVLWDVSSCRLVWTYQHFRGNLCHSPGYKYHKTYTYVCEPHVHLHTVTHSLIICKFKHNYFKNLKIKFIVRTVFYMVQAWKVVGEPDSHLLRHMFNFTILDLCNKRSFFQLLFRVQMPNVMYTGTSVHACVKKNSAMKLRTRFQYEFQNVTVSHKETDCRTVNELRQRQDHYWPRCWVLNKEKLDQICTGIELTSRKPLSDSLEETRVSIYSG